MDSCRAMLLAQCIAIFSATICNRSLKVNSKDGDAPCQAMYDIYRKPSYRETLSRMSIERAAAFSWEKCAHETINVYQTALGGTMA